MPSVSEPGSTVPASVRDIHVGHRALEEGGAPVIDMSVDDSDQERPVRLTGNRFEALSDTAAEPDVARPRRRLVLISQNLEPSASANEWESDTDSIGGASEADVDDVIQETCPFPHHPEYLVLNTHSPVETR